MMRTGYDMMIENAVFHAVEECKALVRSQFAKWGITSAGVSSLLDSIEQAWAAAEAKEQEQPITGLCPPDVNGLPVTDEVKYCRRCHQRIKDNEAYFGNLGNNEHESCPSLVKTCNAKDCTEPATVTSKAQAYFCKSHSDQKIAAWFDEEAPVMAKSPLPKFEWPELPEPITPIFDPALRQQGKIDIRLGRLETVVQALIEALNKEV